MKIRSFLSGVGIGVGLLVLTGFAVEAAEVRVITGEAIEPVLEELRPQFESATGHKLVIWYGVWGTIKRRIESGEAFDLALIPNLNFFIKQGKIAAGTRTEIGRVGMGVFVRAGAPRPDISSVETLKQALLDANGVAYTPTGTVGIHVAKVFERLGIAEQMKPKTKPQQGIDGVFAAVGEGKADLGIGLATRIAPEVEYLGPLPSEVQGYNEFTAGVGTAARQPEAAQALIRFLVSPSAVAVIKTKGMEPANPR